MARTRLLKPAFFTNEDLAACAPLARLLYAALWTVADRDGLIEDRAGRLKVSCLPFDDCDIEDLLRQLTSRGFIKRYEAEGRKVIWIPTFRQHQRPHHKEQPSGLPLPNSVKPKTKKSPGQVGAEPQPSPGSARPISGSARPISGRARSLTLNPSPCSDASASADATSGADVASPRKTPDTPHHRTIAHFAERWQSRYGEKYPFGGGKDGDAVKWMLGQVDEAKLRAVVDRYLADEDSFVVQNRHTIGLLRSQFARWLVDAPPGPPPARPRYRSRDEELMDQIMDANRKEPSS